MSNVMIDIETLSTKSDAAVLSIGLAAFDDQRVVDTHGIAIKAEQVFGTIDVDTVRWWMRQTNAASSYSMNGEIHQSAAWVQFDSFLQKHLHITGEVWAKGPQFDCVILGEWLKGLKARNLVASGARMPWKYSQERDVRTLQNEALRAGCVIPDNWTGTAHNPVDDAANQARQVIALRNALKAATTRGLTV